MCLGGLLANFRICTVIIFFLTSCATLPPPRNVDNICHIFKEYPHWYRAVKDVEKRWKVPVVVQMAILHQESKFDAQAKPPMQYLFGFIPWSRLSTAYGYSQALNGTWDLYKKSDGGLFRASRDDFTYGVDFVGWYANMAYKKAGIPRQDPFKLYLAYHEGVGGYMKQSYMKKPWLVAVAHKVKHRAELYQQQLQRCSLGSL